MNKTTSPVRNTQRLKWLRSASMMAAATAMVAGGSSALAQSRPAPGAAPVGILRDGVPRILTEAREPLPTLNTRALPSQGTVIPTRGNAVGPQGTTQLSIGPVPSAPPAPSFQAFANTDPSFSLLTTTENGISVRASANYVTSEVDYRPSSTGDVVEILGSTAIIDWTTFDAGSAGNTVTFLGSGQNLLFTSDASDFTVLNRITTPGFDSAVRLDGNVTSTVFSGSSIGGNVWFSSAGGIVIGSSATFNIGSLLLSTSTIDPSDVLANPSAINFLGTSDPTSAIIVESGASITANNTNSYVAMVAPRIEQRGTVNVNGSIAYVAAEEATLTIQNNLFDISVSVGSEDDNGILHSGTTSGPASTGVTDEQGIYFVAVPKNDALTMLLSGSIGYSPAASASVVNGQVILTTGNRVERVDSFEFVNQQAQSVSRNTLGTSIDGGPAGNITLQDVNFTSSAQIFAEDTLTLSAIETADGPQNITGGSFSNIVDLDLIGGNAVNLSLSDGGEVSVSGDLAISSGDGFSTGGTIEVNVGSGKSGGGSIGSGGGPIQIGPGGGSNSALSVGGDFTISAGVQGLDDVDGARNNGGTGIGGDGVAGNASLILGENAIVSVGGNVVIDVSANGGGGDLRDGSATAGAFELDVGLGASLDIGGNVFIDASARRAGTTQAADQVSAGEGSDSTAGSVTFNFGAGSVDINAVNINASASASGGTNELIAQSNDATGGTFVLNASGGSYFIGNFSANLDAGSTESYDGNGGRFRGRANRGQATVNIFGADTSFQTGGNFSVFAGADGDAGLVTVPTISISVTDTGSNTGSGFLIDGDLDLSAGVDTGAPGQAAEGGTINVFVDNALLAADGVFIFADASLSPFGPPAETQGNDFRGGAVNVTATNSGIINVSGFSLISSNGTSLVNASSTERGLGEGGTIRLLADDGSIIFGGSLFLEANGFAFPGLNVDGQVGQGIGGLIDITVQGASGSMSFNRLSAETDGSTSVDGEVVSTFFAGRGSDGIGGLTQFNVLGGTLSAADVTVSSDGTGGPGGDRPSGGINPVTGLLPTSDGGSGTGGEVAFNLNGGDATIANLTVSANGLGGRGAFGSVDDNTAAGDGGAATGGTATFNAFAGSLTVTDTLSVEATGNRQFSGSFVSGGEGGSGNGVPGGDGGSARGGNAVFNLDGTAVIDAATVVVSTQAFGGEGGSSDNDFNGNADQGGGRGGDGTGGTAQFNDTAGDLVFGTLTVDASGLGGVGGGSFGLSLGLAEGNGGAGGTGTGGTAEVSLNQDNATPKNYLVISQGQGGDGGEGASSGAGGMGIGGTAELSVNDVAVVFDDIVLDVSASGGNAGFTDGVFVRDGSAGGEAAGGTAQLVVSGPNAAFSVLGVVDFSAGAVGGSGSDGTVSTFGNPNSGNGGSGGAALGGTGLLIAEEAAFIDLNPSVLSFDSDATGGLGGSGGSNFDGGQAGFGGRGGDGTGGGVGFLARTGAEITSDPNGDVFSLSSQGTGGRGGNGGFVSIGSALAGNGGNGGTGTGGSPFVRAIGGTVSAGDIELRANGLGGVGGTRGSDGNTLVALAGVGGDGIGGTPLIEVLEGSPGIVSLGSTSLVAFGTGAAGSTNGIARAGQITINDRSTSVDGLITTGDLFVLANGLLGTNTGLFFVTSNSGPITVDGVLTADVTGAMLFDMIGDGQLVVSGAATLNATDAITISRSGASGAAPAIVTGSAFNATVSAGDFSAGAGSVITADQEISITAQNIAFDTLAAGNDNVFDDGDFALTLNATNGSITGGPAGALSAIAGVDLDATQDISIGDITINDGSIEVDAGGDLTMGNASIASGGLASRERIIINSGGNLTVGDVSAIDDLTMTAVGSFTAGALRGTGVTATAGGEVNIIDASIFNGVANGNDVTISGSAIILGSATANTATGNDINLDATSGSITVGTADAQGFINIDTPSDVIFGDLTALGVFINSGGDVTGDFASSDRAINAGPRNVEITAAGAVNVTEFLTVNSVVIDAASFSSSTITTGLNITSSSSNLIVNAVDDVNIIAADIRGTTNIDAATITLGAIETNNTLDLLSTQGSIDIASLITGQDVIVNSAADITLGTILADGTDTIGNESMSFTAVGDILATGLIRSDDNINLTAGGLVQTQNLSARDNINITAGTSVTTGALEAIVNGGQASAVNITAQSITTGAITTLDGVTLNATAGDLTLSDITAGGLIDLDSSASIDFGTLITGGQILTDAGGSITGVSTGHTGTDSFGNENMEFTAGGDITFTGNLDSDDNINLTAGNDITTQLLEARDNINVTAGGVADVANVLTTDTGNVVITGGSVIVNNGTVDGSFNANSTVGDITFNGTINPTTGLTANSAADINIIDLSIGNGNLTLNAARDVIGANIMHTAPAGDPGLDRILIDAGRDVVVSGTISTLDNAIFVTAAGDVTINQLSASSLNSVIADGAVSIGTLTSIENFDAIITGASVNIDSGNLAAGLIVTSTLGDITGNGIITVADTATFDAAQSIGIGVIDANDIDLNAAQDVRFNGLISPSAISVTALSGTIGATTPGLGDIQSGGAVDLTAQAIDMGDITSATSITASASLGDAIFGDLNAGSFINITASGSPIAQSVTSVGNTTLTGASVGLSGGDVGGDLLLNATNGDITLAFDGAETLLVGGNSTFNATGEMIVTHTNNTDGTLSLDIVGSIAVDVGGSVNAGPGSILSAGPGIFVTAAGDVTLNDAVATGPQGSSNFRGIVINAGALFDPSGFVLFDPAAQATITGSVTSYADIAINAGGNAVFASGSNTSADNSLFVTTGDDIIVEAGAILSSANNPTDPILPALPFDGGPNLVLEAGGLTNLLTVPSTPIASIVLDGTLNANGASIILDANAIEGLDSSLIAGSIKADVRDAPASGVILSDDAGLLLAPCLQGAVCLGNMDAANRIEVGLDSNNDVIQLFIEQAMVSAIDISIVTRNDIVMGTNGINTELNATGTFFANSLTGNVDLRDAAISADQILIDAAGSLLGSGSLSSDNDIGISVGDSIFLGGIDTGGELTTVGEVGGDLEGFYTLPGDFVVGFFSQGASSIDISAGGSIDIFEASTPNDISLFAGGDVFLGFASAPGDIFLDGGSVGYSSLDASNVFITGFGPISGGDILATDDVDIEGDQVDIGDIGAGNLVNITGSSIAVGEVSAFDINLLSGSDILFNGLDSANAIILDASSGSIASNGGAGDIESAGDVTLDALDIAIGGVTSQGSVVANATDGDASFGVVDAANDITITASGSPSVLNAISGGNTTITGSSVTLDNGTIGADLTLLATTGDIDGNGAVSVGGAIDFQAPGNVGFGTLTAQGGSFVVDAGGDVTFAGANSTDFITLTAGGSVLGGDLNATNDVSVDANRIAVGDVIADQIDLTSATDILFDLVQSPNAISLTASGGLIGANMGAGDIISDGAVNLLGVAIDVGAIDAGSNVTAEATDGDLGTGAISANGAVTLDALGGAINTGDIEAASNISADGASISMGDILARGRNNGGFDGGVINLDATGDITLGAANSSGNFRINAGGNLDFTSILVRNSSFSASVGGAVSGGGLSTLTRDGSVSAQTISIDAGGDITLTGAIDTDESITLQSGGSVSAGNLTSAVGRQILVRANGAATVGDIATAGFVGVLVVGTSVSTGSINSGGIQLIADDGSVSVTGDVESAEAVAFTASQSISVQDVFGTGLTLSAGGDVTFGIMVAPNALTIRAGGDVLGTSANRSSASASGSGLFIETDGNVAIDTLASGNSLSVSGQELDLEMVTASTNVTLEGETVSSEVIDAGGNATVRGGDLDLGTVTTGSSLELTGGAIAFESVDAGTSALIAATSGNISGALSAGTTATVTAQAGSITFEGLDAATADLTASGAVSLTDVAVSGLITAIGSSIDVAGPGTLRLDVEATDGDVNAAAGSGLLAERVVASGDVTLESVNSLAATDVSGDNIDILATRGSLELLGLVDARGALTMSGTSLLALDGAAVGEAIVINSQGIDLGRDGFVGDATRTQSITFNFTGNGRIGGSGTDIGGFEFDSSELGFVFSGGDLTFNALPGDGGAPGRLQVQQINLIAGDGSSATGQNIGQTGTVSFLSSGDVVFDDVSESNANLTITNATIDTLIAIEAENLVRINAAIGGIFVTDANGALSGQVDVRATDFMAITDEAFAEIAGLSVAEIDERLANNDGVDRPEGIIRVDSLDIATTASQVFIQNTVSGAEFDERRGFEVNALTISSGGGTGSLQPIVINGTVGGVTGIDTIAQVSVVSPIDPASTINGCLIADPASCATAAPPPPPPPPPPPAPPPAPPPPPPPPSSGGESSSNSEVETRDLIDDGLTPPDVAPEGFLQGGLINLNPDTNFEDDPLIDDPVTGAGNEDLWVPDEEECEDGEECGV